VQGKLLLLLLLLLIVPSLHTSIAHSSGPSGQFRGRGARAKCSRFLLLPQLTIAVVKTSNIFTVELRPSCIEYIHERAKALQMCALSRTGIALASHRHHSSALRADDL
jgi:hypothetical protein